MEEHPDDDGEGEGGEMHFWHLPQLLMRLLCEESRERVEGSEEEEESGSEEDR